MYGIRRIYLWVVCCVFGFQVSDTLLGAVYSMPTAGANNTAEPVIWTYSWNASTSQWTVECTSGPSAGWLGAVSLRANDVIYTAWGQSATFPGNTAVIVGLYQFTTHTWVAGMHTILPAEGSSTTYSICWTLHNWVQEPDVSHVWSPDSVGQVMYARAVQNGEIVASEIKISGQIWKKIEVKNLDSDAPVSLEVAIDYPYAWDAATRTWTKHVGVEVLSFGEWDSRVPTAGDSPACEGWYLDGAGPVKPPVVNAPDPENPPVPPTQPPVDPLQEGGTGKSSGTVWQAQPDEDPVTNKTYIEGTSKIERVMMDGDRNAAGIEAAAAAGAAATDGNGKGNGSDSAKTTVESAFSAGAGTPSFGAPAGSSAGLLISGAYGVTVDLDPLANPSISSLASFVKGVITFVVSALFVWWTWTEFGDAVNQLIHARQAQGNAVLGGTGAQATALVAAAAITAILVAVPVAYWAFAGSTIHSLPAGSGPLAISYYLFSAFVPVTFLATVAATVFVIKKAAVVLVAATATLIRFIVP